MQNNSSAPCTEELVDFLKSINSIEILQKERNISEKMRLLFKNRIGEILELGWNFNPNIEKGLIEQAIEKIKNSRIWNYIKYEKYREYEILYCIYEGENAEECSKYFGIFKLPGNLNQFLFEFGFLIEIIKIYPTIKEKITQRLKKHYGNKINDDIDNYLEKLHILIPMLCGELPEDFSKVGIDIIYDEVKNFLFGKLKTYTTKSCIGF